MALIHLPGDRPPRPALPRPTAMAEAPGSVNPAVHGVPAMAEAPGGAAPAMPGAAPTGAKARGKATGARPPRPARPPRQSVAKKKKRGAAALASEDSTPASMVATSTPLHHVPAPSSITKAAGNASLESAPHMHDEMTQTRDSFVDIMSDLVGIGDINLTQDDCPLELLRANKRRKRTSNYTKQVGEREVRMPRCEEGKGGSLCCSKRAGHQAASLLPWTSTTDYSAMNCKPQAVDFGELQTTIPQMADEVIFPECNGGTSNDMKETQRNIPSIQLRLAEKIVKSDYPCEKTMCVKVPRVKSPFDGSEDDAGLAFPKGPSHSTKVEVPLLRDLFIISFLKRNDWLLGWNFCVPALHETSNANKQDKSVDCTIPMGYGANGDAIIKATKDESMLDSDVTNTAIAGKRSKAIFKGQLAKGENEIVATCATTPLGFCSMLKVVLENSSISLKRKQVLREINLGEPGKHVSSLLRVHAKCWLWMFLIAILLLPSGVYSATASEEGSCRYDLTSVATLSCVLPNVAWRPPSRTCCNALLHAIDHVPSVDESGACCLCRSVKARKGPPQLIRTYVLCKGKDSHIVSEWSPFPFESCVVECRKRDNPSLGVGISTYEDGSVEGLYDTGKDIFKILWVIVSVFVAIGLICFWYFWRFKPAAVASELGRTRPGHKRSPGFGRPAAHRKRRGF